MSKVTVFVSVRSSISKQHVCNFIAMLRLFDQARVNSNPDLFEAVKHVTEHHARVLSRLEDSQTREELAKMIFREKLIDQGAFEFDRPTEKLVPCQSR